MWVKQAKPFWLLGRLQVPTECAEGQTNTVFPTAAPLSVGAIRALFMIYYGFGMWSSPATLGDTSLMNIRSKRLVSGADGCARVCQPQTHWSLPSALRQGCLPWSSSFIHLQNTSLWFCVIVKDLTMEVPSWFCHCWRENLNSIFCFAGGSLRRSVQVHSIADAQRTPQNHRCTGSTWICVKQNLADVGDSFPL